MTTPICGAVPPPTIYGRGVHVEPCILAPEHGGAHEPGNMAELSERARLRSWRNEPVYPGAESHALRGPAIDVGPICLTCGGAVKPCSGTHWHHVEQPTNPHFPSVKETLE